MKKLFLLFVLHAAAIAVSAQNNRCTFQVTTSTYTELGGGVPMNDTLLANDTSTFRIPAMENKVLYLFGEPWNVRENECEIYVYRYGRIQIMRSNDFCIIDGLYAPNFDPIDASSRISYHIEGEILKVQWKNFRIRGGPADNYVNVQTWLYADGTIEFHYGPRSASNASGYTNPATAPYIGTWFSDYSFSHLYEKMNLKGTPMPPKVDSALNMNVPNVQGVPDEGTVLRFVPKHGPATGIGTVPSQEIFAIRSVAGGMVITAQPHSGTGKVTVMDLGGKALETVTWPAGEQELQINTSAYVPGIYLLRVEHGGMVQQRKVAIQDH